jgi:hypothetical protein
MKKTNYIKFLALFFSLLFFSKNGFSQVSSSAGANQKTVIYKLHSHSANTIIDKSTCDNLDKMLMSKKGVVSSKTNGTTWETTAKMIPEVPEKDLKDIFNSLKLEVEKITVSDNKE